LLEDNTTSAHYVGQVTTPVVINQTYTHSWYVKKAQDSWIQILFSSSAFGINYWVNFNFDTGLFGNSGSLGLWTSKQLTNGFWQLTLTGTCTVTGNNGSGLIIGTNNTNSIRAISYLGVAGHQIVDIAAEQFETGSYATPYQKTVAAGDGIVDFNFTRATAATVTNKQGIIEDSAYNLIQYSEDFSNAYWGKSVVTVTANNTVAPDGNITADKIYPTSDSNIARLQILNLAITPSTTYHVSFYVKKEQLNYFTVRQANGVAANLGFTINLNNAQITSGFYDGTQATTFPPTYSATQINNGWIYVTYSFTFTTLITNLLWYLSDSTTTSQLPVGTAAASKGVYIWGAQLTQGSTPRPYLKTTNRLNVPRLDYSRSGVNLLKWSEDFTNPVWLRQSCTITPNTIANPLTGEMNGSTLNTFASPYPSIYQFVNRSSQVVMSIYAKANTLSHLFFVDSAGNTAIAWFNLTNGTVGTSIYPASIQSAGNGWWRCSYIQPSQNPGIIQVGAVNADNTTVGTNGSIYIWGAQTDLGANITPYQKTTTEIKISSEPSLLIEPSRINLFLRSEEFENAVWALNRITISANVTISPGGTQAADKLAETIDGGIHQLQYSSGVTRAVNDIYTCSVYVKAVERTNVYFTINEANTNFPYCNFNLTTGSVGTLSGINNPVITYISNGWYRISITRTTVTAGSSWHSIILATSDNTISYTGTVGYGLYAWGFQLEAGSNATSYIATTTAAVTRNAETNYIDLWNNSLLNRTNWTLFWEGYLYDGVTTNTQLALSDTSAATTNTNQIGWTGALQPFYNISNVRTNGTPTTTNNTFNRFIVRQNSGIVDFFINGIKSFPNRSVATFDYRYLTLNSGSSTYTTDKVALFNRTLTDAESIALTENTSITEAAPFISTWNTNNVSTGSSTSTQVKLPLVSTGIYAFKVDWGDGTINDIGTYNQAETTHTYAVAGTYIISIKGNCIGWRFGNTGDRLKILSVQSWGNFKLGNVGLYFQGCANLNLSSVSDILNLSGTTDMNLMFSLCSSLTSINRINEWDVSNVTNMTSVFNSCTNFNQNLNSWNVSKVTSFVSMFQGASNFNNGLASGVSSTMPWTINTTNAVSMSSMFNTASIFNQDISGWNTSKVIDFTGMFLGCGNFNQPIGTWDTSQVTTMANMFQNAPKFNQNLGSWNTSNVTNLGTMFKDALIYSNLGAPLNWDVSKVTNMFETFRSCKFNQDLGSWNVSNVTNFAHMFNNNSVFNNGGSDGIKNWTFKPTGVSLNSLFYDARAFNQPIGIWDVSMVTNMASMFYDCIVFNQDLGSWNVSNVTNMSNMFSTCYCI
jgi:surface protein